MRVEPVSQINKTKPLTTSGCCDIIDISAATRTMQVGIHRFEIKVVHCRSCGSVKATSNIKEKKDG
jgi:hypothetical protein